GWFQSIAKLLQYEETSHMGLARALQLTPKETTHHLEHVRRSLKERLVMKPAQCQECGYTFKKRSRLDAPGRCPRCRSQRIEGPWFRVIP
ncbi:MAG: hypothetical protein PVG60_05925, partial [Desulfarculaceae bacterium]